MSELDNRIHRFADFSLVPARRVLLRGDAPVAVGSRAFAILLALVERAGSVVPARELMRIAWPGVVVEEANLRVQIASLRKLLDGGAGTPRAIDTVPLQGYCFVLPVETQSLDKVPAPVERLCRYDLPVELATTVGREETVDLLVQALSAHRLVTVTGPGGIGKTTVALAVARRSLAAFRDGARFVDFSPIQDPHLTGPTLASRLGIGVLSDDPMAGLLEHLSGKQVLLVFDTCEHVIEAGAVL